jgi:hypothetical protein
MRMLKTAAILIVSLGLLSSSANAGEKQSVSGINKDFVMISETTATIPDVPHHTFKQVTVGWTTESSNPDWANVRATVVEHQDIKGLDRTINGYGTYHHPNGDVDYFSYEGTGHTTMKEGGAFESVGQGRYKNTGGTGKFKTAKGEGTYICKFTQTGGQCDWNGDVEY